MFAFEMDHNYNAAATVKSYAAKGIHAGTAVTRAILDRLGSPDEKLKIIHIAGTNGKGSTAQFFTSILVAAGKKTGTFTSPEVYDFYDQFMLDNVIIPPETVEKYFAAALKAAEGLDATGFEVQTAGIILAFAEEGCEYAVLECGMGGLGDATNAVNDKVLSVITSVSLEHTSYLGNSIEEICRHKAGIIAKGRPVVVNAHQPPQARQYFGAAGAIFADGVEYNGGKEFSYRGKKYELTAEGCLQPYNAATAIEGAAILGIDGTAVYEGIKNASPRGRLERFRACGREYVLDGAHNPAAFGPLKSFLTDTAETKTIIFGCLSDKDIDGILANIAGLADSVTAVACTGPRARTLAETKAACERYFKCVRAADSVSAALDGAEGETVVVCGSFTILKEARDWIEKKQ